MLLQSRCVFGLSNYLQISFSLIGSFFSWISIKSLLWVIPHSLKPRNRTDSRICKKWISKLIHSAILIYRAVCRWPEPWEMPPMELAQLIHDSMKAIFQSRGLPMWLSQADMEYASMALKTGNLLCYHSQLHTLWNAGSVPSAYKT